MKLILSYDLWWRITKEMIINDSKTERASYILDVLSEIATEEHAGGKVVDIYLHYEGVR